MDYQKKIEKIDRQIENLEATLNEKRQERSETVAEMLREEENRLRELKSQYKVSYNGRAPTGPPKGTPNHTQRKFTPDQVKAMRKEWKGGAKQSALAGKYGVSQPVMSNILRGITYADVK